MHSNDLLNLASFRNAVDYLANSLKALGDRRWLDELPAGRRQVVEAGVIQNFEMVYELSVKNLKRRLLRDWPSSTEIEQAGFRTLLRIGGEVGLIAEVEHWFDYRRKRNITSHTYDQSKAAEVLKTVPLFLEDARLLLAALERRNG